MKIAEKSSNPIVMFEKSCFMLPQNRWDDEQAAKLSEAEILLYRSNLLGSDLTITNFGGGNTSAKIKQIDKITGEETEVLWVKGSGGDIGSMKLDGFSTLYLEKLLRLEKLYRGVEFEDEMVDYLPHCTFNLNPRAASIDTPLHAYLPFKHIDHVHPDSIIAIAAAKDGKTATMEIWGGQVGWLEWKRPGFELGLKLRDKIANEPNLKGIILAGHGLICWGETSKSCYENTISLIQDAANHLNEKAGTAPNFGGNMQEVLPENERLAWASKIMPSLRGIMNEGRSKIGHFCQNPETLEFTCSNDFEKLAALGTSCPDHFLRTKIAPLCLDFNRLEDTEYLKSKIENYRKDYKAYYDRNAGKDDPKMRDANPIVILIPRIGMITFAADKTTARLAAEFYTNAINVMRGAEILGGYLALDENEAFRIEYWALEEAKLQRMPKPKPLAGKIALITGGAGGIGLACANKMLEEGACVVVCDRDESALNSAFNELQNASNHDVVRKIVTDVTKETDMQALYDLACREFGGADIVIANAGIASSAPVEETTMELWRKNYSVLADGYFLASRSAFEIMKKHGGGSIIFIGSKNAIAASPNASAYASAKAASLHLARCLALEGAPFGIRVNVVNPDAVIKGSKIWSGDWRKERAQTFGIDSGEELEAHYRNRSLLKRDVLPEDIAKAVYFFASSMSDKSTGNMINVDAGNAAAFSR